jgi:hypothetical protein
MCVSKCVKCNKEIDNITYIATNGYCDDCDPYPDGNENDLCEDWEFMDKIINFDDIGDR